MSRQRWIVGVMAAMAVVVGACAPEVVTGGPPQPVAPNQRFSGRVNDAGDGATVYTLCEKGAPVGKPVPDQTLKVVADPSGAGDTGSSSSAVFVQPAGSSNVVQLTAYGVPGYLDATIDVPCNGSGEIVFHQCWGIIACLDGSPDVVTVRFEQVGLPFDPPAA